jgi:hypothetical protein
LILFEDQKSLVIDHIIGVVALDVYHEKSVSTAAKELKRWGD